MTSNTPTTDNAPLTRTTRALDQALRTYFGYSSFLPHQEEIVKDLIDCRDVFALMPTGGGKSLCYQLPPVITGKLAVVISPLISLMKDQVDALVANGIKAAFINSSLQARAIHEIQAKLVRGEIQILYVAPERLLLSTFLPLLKSLDIGLFAVDEAHCISEWGHDFRPEYRQLRTLRKEFPTVPIAALTATAEPRVRSDILTQLLLPAAKVYVSSFDRRNLRYFVQPKNEPYDQLAVFLRSRRKESGIVYCQTRKTVETVAAKLTRDGFRALPYHAGLSDNVRAHHQEQFIRDQVGIVVATIAFGMGINKPNVRYVVHYDMPRNIESYYQETGRAGRDGLPADCLLLFGYVDVVKSEHFIDLKSDPGDKQVARYKLREMVNFAESNVCRRKLLLRYFGEEYVAANCAGCDNCITPKAVIDGTIIAQKILSCVSRVGQRFGGMYVTEVLRGSENQKIIRNRHHLLSTFGIGKEFTAPQWMSFIRELIQLGYLSTSGSQYPVLTLNERSRSVLAGTEEVRLTRPAGREAVKAMESETGEYRADLFEALRGLRRVIAAEENLPPYIIFSDATLKEMARAVPRDPDSLRKVSGVGEAKLKKYGHRFLAEIRKFTREDGPLPDSVAARMGAWTKEADENLTLGFLGKKSLAEIAIDLGKPEDAIILRLRRLGLL